MVLEIENSQVSQNSITDVVESGKGNSEFIQPLSGEEPGLLETKTETVE